MSGGGRTWTVIVPLTAAGQRRRAAWPSQALATAVVLDTVEAVAAAESVGRVVLAVDGEVHRRLGAVEAAGAEVSRVLVGDAVGADEIAAAARRHVLGTWGAHRTAVIAGDLPFLCPPELDRTLGEAARFAVATLGDADGRRSVLQTFRDGDRMPEGADSDAGHAAQGWAELDRLPNRSLRRDVDTLDHLAMVIDSDRGREWGWPGSAPRTRAALRALGRAGVEPIAGWRALAVPDGGVAV
ncbi:hypothetical protein [Agromyces sp. NPDC058126]|uniref:hypothetical protein n=1 Tax=Agromyces sp. NPDC058126 TaxID=3346350 RepID=UPI0036D77E18